MPEPQRVALPSPEEFAAEPWPLDDVLCYWDEDTLNTETVIGPSGPCGMSVVVNSGHGVRVHVADVLMNTATGSTVEATWNAHPPLLLRSLARTSRTPRRPRRREARTNRRRASRSQRRVASRGSPARPSPLLSLTARAAA